MSAKPAGNGNGSETLLLTVREAGKLLRVSRNRCYELIRQGRIPHLRLGRRILIPRHGLETWINEEAGVTAPPAEVVSFNPQRH